MKTKHVIIKHGWVSIPNEAKFSFKRKTFLQMKPLPKQVSVGVDKHSHLFISKETYPYWNIDKI